MKAVERFWSGEVKKILDDACDPVVCLRNSRWLLARSLLLDSIGLASVGNRLSFVDYF